MMQFKSWPPPDWTECVVPWDWILKDKKLHPNNLYEWCDKYASPNRYHVHGWRSTEGFSFRFEDARDATVFKLTWPAL